MNAKKRDMVTVRITADVPVKVRGRDYRKGDTVDLPKGKADRLAEKKKADKVTVNIKD
jgi:hypothetical protein